MRLGGFPDADVPDCCRHQRLVRVSQRAEHDLDRKFAAVLALPDQLDAGADLLGERVFRGPQIVCNQTLGKADRNDVRDFLSEQFVAPISELLFGLQIQKNDFAALIDDDHGIGRRLHEAAIPALHLRNNFLGILARADVAYCGRDENSLVAFERTEHDLDRKFAAVAASPVQLDAGADLLGKRVLGRSQVVGDQPLRKAFGNDVRDLLPEQFIAPVAELFFGLKVEQNDLAGLIDDHHGVRRGFHQSAIGPFDLGEYFIGVLANADGAHRDHRGQYRMGF